MEMTLEELLVAFDPKHNMRDFTLHINMFKIGDRMDSIRVEGLITPLEFNKRSGFGTRGYIRAAAIQRLAVEYPADFTRIFPNGKIPVTVVDLSPKEAADRQNDHGQVEGLEQVEVYESAKRLFQAGYGISEVAVKLGGQLNTFSTNPGKLAAKVANLPTEEADRIRKGYRKGTVERLNYVYKLPRCVEKAWLGKRSGKGAEFDLTNGNLTELHKAYSADCKADKSTTRNKPGKLFLDKWEDIQTKGIAKKEAGHKPHDTRKWTQLTVRNNIDNYTSKAMRDLMFKCGGDTEVELTDAVAADALLEMIEVVKEKDSEFYAVMYEELVRKYEEVTKEA